VNFDIGNVNQDDDPSFDIGNGNNSIDVSFDMGNGNSDDDASIDSGSDIEGTDASFNSRDGNQNCRDAIDGADAEVVELARAFQSPGTERFFELVWIYTALYPIHDDCFLDVSCIPKYIA